VASPKHKQPLAPTIGFGVLMLQAMTTPFAFTSALRTTSDQPGWVTGLFLAADLGAVAALAFIAFGRRTRRSTARFAPTALVLPAWMAIALLSPVQHASFGAAAMYSLYALVVGALSAAPFLTKEALALFEGSSARSAQAAGAATSGPLG
jgi:hypothetical protein